MSAEGRFDVAIVGTGMGGGTLGYALARAGLRVAFLEKGESNPRHDASAAVSEDPDRRLRSGHWPTRITGAANGVEARFFPPLGCGVGGSSLLYAAALERLEPHDLEGALHASSRWPIRYEELRRHYEEAERLFGVHGTGDPLQAQTASSLASPPPLGECDQRLMQVFEAAGLNPYRLHVGNSIEAGCTECLGHVCDRACKGDARVRCVLPALATGNAVLFDRCDVERLEANARSVTSVRATRGNEQLSIRARTVVLSAGALNSPALLLKSASYHWPGGLANQSGLVGRNLMFHVSDWLAVWCGMRPGTSRPRKSLAMRDFRDAAGRPFGALQSTGLTAGYGNIVGCLRAGFDRSGWRWARPVRPMLRIPAALAAIAFGQAALFATIMEDMPYPENRVVPIPGKDRIRFEYTMRPELLERHAAFRSAIRKRLGRIRHFFINQEPILNYGHPCGTCRAGNDPATSVVDRFNKAHGMDNLYIVDASFMPSSGGANPALTIAANALRVAEHIKHEFAALADSSTISS